MPIFCQYNPKRPKIDHQTTRGLKSTSRASDLTRIYINGFVHPIEERRLHTPGEFYEKHGYQSQVRFHLRPLSYIWFTPSNILLNCSCKSSFVYYIYQPSLGYFDEADDNRFQVFINIQELIPGKMIGGRKIREKGKGKGKGRSGGGGDVSFHIIPKDILILNCTFKISIF